MSSYEPTYLNTVAFITFGFYMTHDLNRIIKIWSKCVKVDVAISSKDIVLKDSFRI